MFFMWYSSICLRLIQLRITYYTRVFMYIRYILLYDFMHVFSFSSLSSFYFFYSFYSFLFFFFFSFSIVYLFTSLNIYLYVYMYSLPAAFLPWRTLKSILYHPPSLLFFFISFFAFLRSFILHFFFPRLCNTSTFYSQPTNWQSWPLNLLQLRILRN